MLNRISPYWVIKCLVRLHSILLCLVLTISANIYAAEVIADLQDLRLEGKRYLGNIQELVSVTDETLALLTDYGVIEVDLDFQQLASYKFDRIYGAEVIALRFNDELYIIGQRAVLSLNPFRGARNDVHLLRYGETAPLKIWKCRWCTRPVAAYFFDYENPVIAWAKSFGTRETLRIVQLGTDREWFIDSPGYDLCSGEVVGLRDKTRGLQDIVYNLAPIDPDDSFFDHDRCRTKYTKTVRLSNVDLENPIPMNDHIGVEPGAGIGPALAEYQNFPFRIYHLGWIDRKNRTALINIQHYFSNNDASFNRSGAQLQWKIKVYEGFLYLRHLIWPGQIDCRTEEGTQFDTFLILSAGLKNCGGKPCGGDIYELRPGGNWRVAFHDDELAAGQYGFALAHHNHVYYSFNESVVRLDRGTDYCVTDPSRFQASLPMDSPYVE